MDEIQQLIADSWDINYGINGGSDGWITGTTNDFGYSWEETGSIKGTVIPKSNPCGWMHVSCTVPAQTGSLSAGFQVEASVKGFSDAITPLLDSTTFTSGTMTQPTPYQPAEPAYTLVPAQPAYTLVPGIPGIPGSAQMSPGVSAVMNPATPAVPASNLTTETIEYNFDQVVKGDLIQISGSAAITNIKFSYDGIGYNFGDIKENVSSYPGEIPDIPIYFNAIIEIPSFNDEANHIANGVGYELFPQATELTAENISISTGVNVLCDFIIDSLLDPLTSAWNNDVCSWLKPISGGWCPEAPSAEVSDYITEYVNEILPTVNTQIETNFNADMDSLLPTINPYVQAITAATWDYSDYPIVPNGNYKAAILTSGLFSGVDASNSDFTNANCQSVDFSYANLTGCDFTGANLAGANLSGATGAPASLKTNAYLEPASGGATSSKAHKLDSKPNFDGAVLHGANLKGTNLDLTGAYYDANTQFDDGFNAAKSGLKKFHPHLFIVTNDLYEYYGNNVEKVVYDFANDNSPCGCKGKPGLRTKLNNGEYRLSKFKGQKYYKTLSDSQKIAVDTYLSENTDEDRDNYLASLKVDDLMKGLRLNADKGGDEIVGGYGNDRIYGDSGEDKLYGNTGDDYLSGGKGDDRLTGNDGNDILKGRLGDDTLTGGDGADIFMAGKGKDVVKDFDYASGDIIQIDKGWEYEFISKGDNTIIDFGDYGSMKLRDVDKSLFDGNVHAPPIELI
ncbi:pentapeptide repeat-containing protein [Prochlorococcus marinus]|uniref:pentapeptide repeat-containing protein n=1 Tax=Prochlorococcus TaxID=1218 RepID=UPI0018C86FB8|nr:pentapeptide repeat-containing protein [Prochlorococcus marinus]